MSLFSLASRIVHNGRVWLFQPFFHIRDFFSFQTICLQEGGKYKMNRFFTVNTIGFYLLRAIKLKDLHFL